MQLTIGRQESGSLARYLAGASLFSREAMSREEPTMFVRSINRLASSCQFSISYSRKPSLFLDFVRIHVIGDLHRRRLKS